MIHTGTSIYLPNGIVINLLGKTEEEINMITINKQSVEDYTTYKELEKKIKRLEESLKEINHKEVDISYLLYSLEMKRFNIASLYDDNKELIDKTLYEEVERLKGELSKYIIE